MPLFESLERRTQRLFDEEFKALYDLVCRQSPNDPDRRLAAAWLMGALSAARIVVGAIGPLKNAWGNGDRTQAAALMQVFVQPMISWWYRQLDKSQQHSEGEKRTARVLAASNILMLFGNYSEEAVAEFMNMDIQFNWDLDQAEFNEQGGRLWLFSHILLSKAVGACQQASRLDLRSVTVPLTRFDDLRAEGGDLDSWNPVETVAFQSAVSKAARIMFECYKTWSGSANVK